MRDLANECRGELYAYLGHFRNPEFLRQGHNDGYVVPMDPSSMLEENGLLQQGMAGANAAPSSSGGGKSGGGMGGLGHLAL